MSAFLRELQRHGREISQQVLDDMYRDPFWSERYGARGRRHADEDSDFHLQYLRRALEAGDPGVMQRYARWLRGVLNSRGMCTRHLDENFERLAHALADRGWEGHGDALACIESARAALRHERAEARALQADAPGLARKAAAAMTHAGRAARLLREPGELAADFETLFAYLADALESGDAAGLRDYLKWLGECLQRAGRPGDTLAAALDAAAAALEGTPHAGEVARMLASAQEVAA